MAGGSRLKGFLVMFMVWNCVVSGQIACAACPSFSRLISNGAYAIADSNGRIVAACQPDVPLIPASILKIPTALTALSILGSQYRFKTLFYMDSHHNLYIKGFGDPLLISEEITLIYTALMIRGVDRINSLFVDNSSFALEHQVPGREASANPYDAPVGPVVVNFNSVSVRITRQHTIVSGEAETPYLPIMKELAQDSLPGTYRINICQQSCHPDQQMARYTTELFRAIQQSMKIAGQGDTGIRSVPADAELVYTHYSSKTLEELLSSMLKYSSNFIANLVYLSCGAHEYGYPATWAKAHKVMEQVLRQQLGEKAASAIVFEEGAGLSRNNRVTSRAMLAALNAFRPYSSLLRKYQGCLTKSGSMKRIYNYAGYLPNGRAYVVLLNQRKNTRVAILKKMRKGRYAPFVR